MKNKFNAFDPLDLESQLSDAEKSMMRRARDFANTYLKPAVTNAFRDQRFDPGILKLMGEQGFLGSEDMSRTAYGLVNREFEKVDSGFRTLLSVTKSLVMTSIELFGSEAQQQQFLPKLKAGECVASFALTEADYGSDPGEMQTQAVKTKAGFEISGHKRWIGLAEQADLLVVWAKLDDRVRGFLVEKNAPGLSCNSIEGKFSLRVVPSADVLLDKVQVTEAALLPNTDGLKSALQCLNNARFGIGWGALGAAESCFQIATEYVKDRADLNAKQLIQQKLADMCSDIAIALQTVLRVSRLLEADSANPQLISLIKRNSTRVAINVARSARDILGGNGIVDEFGVIRHLLNLESVNTYEGTADIHSLILGRAITGVSAI